MQTLLRRLPEGALQSCSEPGSPSVGTEQEGKLVSRPSLPISFPGTEIRRKVQLSPVSRMGMGLVSALILLVFCATSQRLQLWEG